MKHVLITGATSGFGKLMAESFLTQGNKVIATGRNLTARTEILASLRERFGDRLIELNLDVTNKTEVELAVTKVTEQVGRIDVLINNAGYGLFGPLETTSEELIRHQMEVNFFGTVNVTKAFLPMLRESKGKIFNFSSVFGFMGFPLTSLYCASKFAVEGLTESLRGELAPHGVQVCLIEPGGYGTNFGESIGWVEDGKVYENQIRNYQSLRKKFASSNPQNPREVADGVVKLASRNTLPMRQVFGRDGRLSLLMRRTVPAGLYFRILDQLFKKIFVKGISRS